MHTLNVYREKFLLRDKSYCLVIEVVDSEDRVVFNYCHEIRGSVHEAIKTAIANVSFMREEGAWDDGYDYDDSMDGDHESALASAGWGTDEDYGYYGEDY